MFLQVVVIIFPSKAIERIHKSNN